LNVGLDAAVWDSATRGPLIAVAPEVVRPAWQVAIRKPQIGPDGNMLPIRPPQPPERMTDGRYRITDLADFFGRRVVRLKGMSVLAPTEMVVLNTKLGRPDYFANLQSSEKLRMLQASLTAAQWKILGSANGLGVDDLTGEQRELFLSYIPDPMVIRRQRALGNRSWTNTPDDKPVIVSGAQRSGVRLRINRTAQFSVPLEGDANFRHQLGNETAGTDIAVLNTYNNGYDREKLYGQQVRSTVPNRLKPQQIDFAAPTLQAEVSLAGVKTVGELMARIRTATRTEIFADGRAAKQLLWIRADDTQTVRASDALQALCWSLTGAIRYVSDGSPKGVFILTEDLEGIGSRLARISEWTQAAQEHASQTQRTLQEAIQKQQPLQHIGFAPEDPNALTGKASKTVEDGWKTTMGRYQGAMIPLSDLSAEQQELVRQGIASYDKTRSTYNGEHRDIVNNGTVSVSVQVRTCLLVPGVGEVRDQSSLYGGGDFISGLLPPTTSYDQNPAAARPKLADVASVPASMPVGGVLFMTPKTEEDARKVVRAARERGFKQVWLLLPVSVASAEADTAGTNKSKALISAAIAEAQKQKPLLEIVAGLRLFSLSPSSDLPDSAVSPASSEDTQDVTITGEPPIVVAQRRVKNAIAADTDPAMYNFNLQNTRGWVRPDSPGLSERLAKRLSEIARTPGLSGMALLDTAPPGYSMPPPSRFFSGQDNKIAVGYTPAARVAFIRSVGFDPIDIHPGAYVGTVDLRLPFFADEQPQFLMAPPEPRPTGVNSEAEWNRFRVETVTRSLASLYRSLKSSLPQVEGGFPLYLQNLDTGTNGYGWFSRWEKGDAVPRRAIFDPMQPQNAFQEAQKASAVSLIDLGYVDYPQVAGRSSLQPLPEPVSPPVQFARSVNSMLNYNKGAWAGLVLNFSAVSVDKALEMIQGIVPPEKAPPVQKPGKALPVRR
ncbi:MAG: hypothetical protein V4671_17615, partial [Armatimonadota bacterium]